MIVKEGLLDEGHLGDGQGHYLGQALEVQNPNWICSIQDVLKECAQKKHASLGVKLERKQQASMWSQAKTDFPLIHGERVLEQKSPKNLLCEDQSLAVCSGSEWAMQGYTLPGQCFGERGPPVLRSQSSQMGRHSKGGLDVVDCTVYYRD